jgi:endoplasmic reticulum Man9GlcNAc2 1,2-alpha-mannosidase
MSFSVPRNVPSFGNPQRLVEDRLWASSGVTARSGRLGADGGLLHGVQDRVGGFFDNRNTLPMYKDKPYTYAVSRRMRPLYRRKRVLGLFGLIIILGCYFFGVFSSDGDSHPLKQNWKWPGLKDSAKGKADWSKRRDMVVEAFELSWDAYERYAWGAFPPPLPLELSL